MPKTILWILCLSLMILGLAACGGKYDDAVKINEEFTALIETYVADLDQAQDAADTAKAMNTFAEGLEELMPRMKKISEKYPELKNKEQLPAELQESNQKGEEAAKQLAQAVFKTMPHMSDPEVAKAQQRVAAAWMTAAPGN